MRKFLYYYLLFAIFILPWIGGNNFSTTNTKGFIWFVLLFGIGIIFFVFNLFTGGIHFKSDKKYIIPAVWIFTSLISAIFGLNFIRSVFGSFGFHNDGLIYYSFLALTGIVIYNLDLDRDERNILLSVIILQASIIAVQAIGEFYHHDDTYRVKSVLNNSDYYLSYLTLMLPLIVGYTVKFWREKRLALGILFTLMFVLNLYAGYLSIPQDLRKLSNVTSEDFVVTPVVGIASISGVTPDLFRSLAITPALAASEAVTPDSFRGLSSFLSTPANQERFNLWKLGIKIGNNHLLTGVGPGNFRLGFYEEAKNLPNWDYSSAPDFPHNETVQNYANGGILGLITYLGISFNLLFFMIKTWRNSSQKNILTLSLICSLTLFWLFNQVLFTSIIPGIIAVIFIALTLQKENAKEA